MGVAYFSAKKHMRLYIPQKGKTENKYELKAEFPILFLKICYTRKNEELKRGLYEKINRG